MKFEGPVDSLTVPDVTTWFGYQYFSHFPGRRTESASPASTRPGSSDVPATSASAIAENAASTDAPQPSAHSHSCRNRPRQRRLVPRAASPVDHGLTRRKIRATFATHSRREGFQRVRHHRQRPLPVESSIGRQHTCIRTETGLRFIEGNVSTPAAAFEPAHHLTVMRGKCFTARAGMNGPSALLLGVGDGPARQHVAKKSCAESRAASAIGNSVAEEAATGF